MTNGFHLFELCGAGAVHVDLHQVVVGGYDEEGLPLWRQRDITSQLLLPSTLKPIQTWSSSESLYIHLLRV